MKDITRANPAKLTKPQRTALEKIAGIPEGMFLGSLNLRVYNALRFANPALVESRKEGGWHKIFLTPAGLAAIGRAEIEAEAAPATPVLSLTGDGNPDGWQPTRYTFTLEELAQYDPDEPIAPDDGKGATADDTIRNYEYEVQALKAENARLQSVKDEMVNLYRIMERMRQQSALPIILNLRMKTIRILLGDDALTESQHEE